MCVQSLLDIVDLKYVRMCLRVLSEVKDVIGTVR